MTSVVVGILTFIVGAMTGFFAQRFFVISPDQSQLKQQVLQSENDLAQYKQEVAQHLEKSANLLAQMNVTCQTAMQQMAQSTQLLQQATPKINHMPFFSEETQQQLAATVHERRSTRRVKQNQNKEAITQPPLDYSSGPSGIFADQKQAVTNTES
jgi:uncharacterized protein